MHDLSSSSRRVFELKRFHAIHSILPVDLKRESLNMAECVHESYIQM